MKTYEEMAHSALNRIRKEKEIQKRRRKAFLRVLVTVSILLGTAISAYAVSNIIKNKNKYQLAAEKGEDISSVDSENNLSFTKFDSIDNNESFSDLKTEIYNKMLNTVDHIDAVHCITETSMLREASVRIEYFTDTESGRAYQIEYSDDTVYSEAFSDGNTMIFVDRIGKGCISNYLPVYSLEDTPYIPLDERITVFDDGIPCYNYRRNVTNCPLASYCLVPQEIAFNYLKDFDKWDIEDEDYMFLGRKCVYIKGVPNEYVSEKHSTEEFSMIVDFETGILMKFENYNLGKIVDYIEIKECDFDFTGDIKRFSKNDYKDYSMSHR